MLKKISLLLLVGFLIVSLGALWLSYRYPARPPASTTTPTSSATSTSTSYSLQEVAQHTTPDNCWLVVRNNVYNVSSYINHHPGGRSAITTRCGREVTSIFTAIHSNRAWDLLGQYRIGTLDTAVTSPTTTVNITTVTERLKTTFPDSEVLKVQPYGTGYLALIVTGNTLWDVVLDAQGTVISQAARNDEFEWFWDANDDEVKEFEHQQ